MTPPHSAGMYMYTLFDFFLFGILFASSCSRRCSLLPCRVCACVSVCAWGGGCGGAVRGSEPSRVPGFACMCDTYCSLKVVPRPIFYTFYSVQFVYDIFDPCT